MTRSRAGWRGWVCRDWVDGLKHMIISMCFFFWYYWLMDKIKKIKIYVTCALTQAPEEFRREIEKLKDSLRGGYEILDFVGLVGGTATDVYKYDTECVKSCDLLVAICDYPSTGMGYEIGFALSLNKQILAVGKEGAKITRLVLGVDHPAYTFSRYREFGEIKKLIEDKLN